PRDYTKESKQVPPKYLFTKCPGPGKLQNHEGWYQRLENNGWRPVSDRVWDERRDEITDLTSSVKLMHHHLKFRRRQDVERKRKEKKLKWLRYMYERGMHAQVRAQDVSNTTLDTTCDEVKDPEEMKSEEELMTAIERLEKELDYEVMHKWFTALNFDDYIHNWLTLSMTGKSDDPTTFEINIDGDSDYGQGLTKKLRHVRDVSEFHGEQQDDLLAEIDLFRKIADETQAPVPSICEAFDMEPSRNDRPRSGASQRSITLFPDD
ncbi:hypothetical protein HDU96_004689, partial [Phlyctochytrium bullatum]